MQKESKEPVIKNVRFKNTIQFHGGMPTNVMQGWQNAIVTESRSGVVVEIPEDKTIGRPHILKKIPYSNISDIEYEV